MHSLSEVQRDQDGGTAAAARMIPDFDIWRAAAPMTQSFRRDAASQAAARADKLLTPARLTDA
jgi:hypothetical protein